MAHSTNNKTSGFFNSLKLNYNQKFANVSISFNESDGSNLNDTLIHSAFIKYFDKKNQPYPDWLGEENERNKKNDNNYDSVSQNHNYSQYQPVPQNNRYNNSYNNRDGRGEGLSERNRDGGQGGGHSEFQSGQRDRDSEFQRNGRDGGQSEFQTRSEFHGESLDRPVNRRKSSLQALHDRSRQQSVPGAGYTSQNYTPGSTPLKSTTGSRLREKMLQERKLNYDP